ncbi:hypothetical protein V3C99_003971 [Haemonchus contortus]
MGANSSKNNFAEEGLSLPPPPPAQQSEPVDAERNNTSKNVPSPMARRRSSQKNTASSKSKTGSLNASSVTNKS